MPFKHKLSRRLSVLKATPLLLLCAVAISCSDVPSEPTNSGLDGSFPNAINPATTKIGDRVRTDRYVEVRGDAPKSSKVIGSQKPGATGRIVSGPTPLTWDLYPRWQVDFDSGPDGWVYGSFLNRVDPIPTPTPTPEPTPEPTPTITTVVVTPATASVLTGSSVQLSAVARDQDGATMSATFAWTSTSASIATVSSTGRVQGVAAGTARIIATASGRADTSVVTVTAPAPIPAPVASISVSPSNVQVLVGATTSLTATLRDGNGNTLTGRSVQWSSSASSISTVSASGTVTGVAVGWVTITATSEGRSGSATVQVTAPAPTPPPSTGGQLTFASDWSTATGRTTAAFGDGGAWTGFAGDNNRNVDISTAASLGLQNWPTVNAYRVGNQPTSPTSIATHQLWKDLGTPTAGSHRYYRFYMQMVYPDALGNGTVGNIEHGVESADAAMGGGDGMNLIRIPRSNGTWFLGYRDIRTAQRWYASDLQLRKNRTYRLEWHLAFGSSSYRVEIRVYDEYGALVATAADFKPSQGTGATRTLDQDQVPWTPSAGAAYRYFRVGTNGPSSNYPIGTLGGQTLYVHGAVATSNTDWAGPYRAGERP